MDLQDVRSSVINGVTNLSGELQRFARLERILAVLLLLTPALLFCVNANANGIRNSISAYHDVSTPPAFYVPLTVGAMLFFVNGIVRDAHSTTRCPGWRYRE